MLSLSLELSLFLILDVYAQDSRQEEDVLNPERLKKGYQVGVLF